MNCLASTLDIEFACLAIYYCSASFYLCCYSCVPVVNRLNLQCEFRLKELWPMGDFTWEQETLKHLWPWINPRQRRCIWKRLWLWLLGATAGICLKGLWSKDKSTLQQKKVHHKASVPAEKPMMQQVHLEAPVVVHEVVLEHLKASNREHAQDRGEGVVAHKQGHTGTCASQRDSCGCGLAYAAAGTALKWLAHI